MQVLTHEQLFQMFQCLKHAKEHKKSTTKRTWITICLMFPECLPHSSSLFSVHCFCSQHRLLPILGCPFLYVKAWHSLETFHHSSPTPSGGEMAFMAWHLRSLERRQDKVWQGITQGTIHCGLWYPKLPRNTQCQASQWLPLSRPSEFSSCLGTLTHPSL